MSLFAVATVFNMNLLNENGAGDVSLDALAVMAQAQDESIGPTRGWENPFSYENLRGFESTSGDPCYAYTTSVTSGGSYTVTNGSTNSATIAWSYNGPSVGGSVTNHSGQSMTVNWSATRNQILLGYTINCKGSYNYGSCKSKSCNDIKMRY